MRCRLWLCDVGVDGLSVRQATLLAIQTDLWENRMMPRNSDTPLESTEGGWVVVCGSTEGRSMSPVIPDYDLLVEIGISASDEL